MDLFDMPETRGSKQNDKKVIAKAGTKKPASTVIKGNGILGMIPLIVSTVESKLGKYKNDYIYYMQDQEELFKEYCYNIKYTGVCAIDTETTGLNANLDTIVGASLYSKGQKGLYLPIHHKSYITGMEVEGQLSEKLIAEQLQMLVDNHVKFEYYNAAFDIRIIKNNLGVYVPAWFDCHLAAMCLDENEQHGLKPLHSKYVLEGKEDEWSFGGLFKNVPFDLVPISTAYIYAARDAVDTDELADFQIPYLTKDNPLCIESGLEKVSDVFWNIEMPYVDVIVNMEQTGVEIDFDYAQELHDKYTELQEAALNKFYDAVHTYDNKINAYKVKNLNHKLSDPINVASTTQLAILLYDIIEIGVIDSKNPRGTGEEIISQVDNPVCKAILEYRKVAKLLSTYIDTIPEMAQLTGCRIKCNFNQYGAKTGRLSSDEPNLQNIPSHNKDIRKMFKASEGYVMLSSDYSQQEPRCMTAMCGDETMLQAYREGKDLYASIAALAFNTTYENCLEFNSDGTTNKEGKERRSSAKSILLGILYGRGINSVAEQLHTTKEKAQQIQDKVFKGFPAIKKFEEDTIKMARDLGYVTTFWGRKRRLPEMQLSEYEFRWREGYGDEDPLAFDDEVSDLEVSWDIQRKYITMLHKAYGKDKEKIKQKAKDEGLLIIDNGGKIADATRQCVNSRIQGSAADLSKMAGILIHNNERLKELGFRLLIPIHDEYLAECPKENVKECAELFSKCMCDAATDLGIPISCDVSVTERWYGDEIEI